MRLAGRRILITGGGSGIGLATAAMFVEEGARVGIVDKDPTALESASTRIGDQGVTRVADVTVETDVTSAVDEIADALGGLDGVVNSAGVDFIRPFLETSSAEWNRIMAVNVTGPFHICHAALPHLKASGFGTIVNVSSAAGLRPLEHRTAYCSSKAALIMLTKTLAAELFEVNVRANVICPGIIETPLFQASFRGAADPDAELRKIMDRYVIKRAGTPEEIASAILFLTSRESSYMTGAAIAVDGGRTFH
jgi:NAD(P)-dependent dehydrogenase (short-subunit alcohol dehydrogenase family)